MRLVVTAGFDGSQPAIALCELLNRAGHNVHTVIVVTPFSFRRFNQMLLQRGISGIKKIIIKLLASKHSSPLISLQEEFLSANNITSRSLKAWCRKVGAKYQLVKSINSKDSISALILLFFK
mgnify:CR=1 FL=1